MILNLIFVLLVIWGALILYGLTTILLVGAFCGVMRGHWREERKDGTLKPPRGH